MTTPTQEKDTLSYEEAIALLPEGDDIHTFLGFIGASWRREQILAALKEAPEILLTGPMAQAMGHGMAIFRPGTRSPLMIQTVRRTDRASSSDTER